jgi:hypothetical protein
MVNWTCDLQWVLCLLLPLSGCSSVGLGGQVGGTTGHSWAINLAQGRGRKKQHPPDIYRLSLGPFAWICLCSKWHMVTGDSMAGSIPWEMTRQGTWERGSCPLLEQKQAGASQASQRTVLACRVQTQLWWPSPCCLSDSACSMLWVLLVSPSWWATPLPLLLLTSPSAQCAPAASFTASRLQSDTHCGELLSSLTSI